MQITLNATDKQALLKYIDPVITGDKFIKNELAHVHTTLNKASRAELIELVTVHIEVISDLRDIVATSTPPERTGIPMLDIEVTD